jgi:RNA polymerase subunit RPABC4/transcription elongation factor Spt4
MPYLGSLGVSLSLNARPIDGIFKQDFISSQASDNLRGFRMQCGSCVEEIPNDSIFCPECGARQETSRAGSFANTGSVGLGGQEVSGGRSFGVVSGEAVRQQRDMDQGQAGGLPPEVLQQIAMGVQQQQNLPQGQFPPQGLPPNQMGQFPPQGLPPNQMGQFPPQGLPPNQMGQFPPQGLPPQNMPPQQMGQFPPQNQQPTNVVGGAQSDLPQQLRGPTLSSGALPQKNPANVTSFNPAGTTVASNPSASPTDAMVNRLAEAERAMKDERRSQWLNMNQTPAGNVLASLGAELPAHLRGEDSNAAKEIMAGAMGQSPQNSPDEALLRRMCEVAVRRVARKRGVAVETPQSKTEGTELNINVTYVDDGRVLDTPDDLKQAFAHAIQTELALKGFDLVPALTLFRSKDGEVESLDKDAESDEEMFACEICDGLVKESDSECPHCGAMFEDEEEEVEAAPKRSGPPGPSKSGGPPKKSGGPPGPSKSGGPPKKGGGPPGPSKSGGPPKKGGGPPGPSKSGGPPKKSGGPPGPSKSGGPPKKGGGPPGPSKSGGPPKKSGGPPGPRKSGGPPKRSGPPKGGPGGGPSGPKRGPR